MILTFFIFEELLVVEEGTLLLQQGLLVLSWLLDVMLVLLMIEARIVLHLSRDGGLVDHLEGRDLWLHLLAFAFMMI